MQNAAGDGVSAPSDGSNDSYHAVVSDLLALIAHVQSSIHLMESVMASEPSLDNPKTNIIVLDDVSPRYARANAALNAASAGLRVALHFLQDARPSKNKTDEPAERDLGSVRSIRHA
jgi:hypothetical protein